ncbi:outer membrane beta-barrel protein [Pigmentibacter ruber]
MKKILLTLAASSVITMAYAKGNPSTLMFQGGYSSIDNYKNSDDSSDNPNFPQLSGWNMGAMYMAPFIDNSNIHPVLGGGLSYNYTTGHKNNGINSYDLTLSSLDLAGTAGLKFNVNDKFDLYTLVNLNVAAITKQNEFYSYGYTGIVKIYSAGSFGFSIIPTYNIDDKYSIGFGYFLGKRVFVRKADGVSDKTYTGTEQSFNVVFGINI